MINNLLHFIAVQFIFIPSPNIEVDQPGHYQCSVDHTGVKIAWYINGTLATNINGITTNGEGSHISSLTIPGYPQYNNSEVECYAFGSVNGINYINNSVAILLIQGNTLSNIHKSFNS